jgi:hypothetical protein
MPPPTAALFPEIVLLVTVSVPPSLFQMPPPSLPLFPEIVLLVMVIMPPSQFAMPPAPPALFARDRAISDGHYAARSRCRRCRYFPTIDAADGQRAPAVDAAPA